MHRCSPRAGAGWRAWRSRCRASAAARRCAPQLARMEAEDLVATVFPDQMACAENIAGDREIPDHPLTNQTISDCLHEAMDIEGLERLLARIESGEIRVVARDLTQPSPLALEVLSARPYAYLDDAPLEERRTQAVMARRWLAPESAAELGQPRSRRRSPGCALEAWPDPANAEELHDALLWLGCLNDEEVQAVPEWSGWLAALARDNRVTQRRRCALWVAAERAQQFQSLTHRHRSADANVIRAGWKVSDRSRPAALAEPLGLEPDDIAAALVCAGGRRLRPARPLHSGHQRRRMVRSAAARAHPSLHGPSPARRNRTGRRARLPALPVRLAARDGGDAAGRAGLRCRRRSHCLRASRRRPARGRPNSCPPASLATNRPGWTICAWPDASPGRD